MTRLKLKCAGLVQTQCGQIQNDGYTHLATLLVTLGV